MNDSPLNAALRHFEAAEANLVKIEKVLTKIEAAIPQGIAFGDNPEYESNCRSFNALLESLPKINGWKPEITLMDLDEIAQNRFDAQEVGEIECLISVERQIGEPSRLLREYRYRFNQKRRELIRDSIIELIDSIDGNLRELSKLLLEDHESNETVDSPAFEELQSNVAQINTLLGSSVSRPPRWPELHRHMHFGMLGDLHDIIEHDWPSVKAGLRRSLYGEQEPVPVGVAHSPVFVVGRPFLFLPCLRPDREFPARDPGDVEDLDGEPFPFVEMETGAAPFGFFEFTPLGNNAVFPVGPFHSKRPYTNAGPLERHAPAIRAVFRVGLQSAQQPVRQRERGGRRDHARKNGFQLTGHGFRRDPGAPCIFRPGCISPSHT